METDDLHSTICSFVLRFVNIRTPFWNKVHKVSSTNDSRYIIRATKCIDRRNRFSFSFEIDFWRFWNRAFWFDEDKLCNLWLNRMLAVVNNICESKVSYTFLRNFFIFAPYNNNNKQLLFYYWLQPGRTSIFPKAILRLVAKRSGLVTFQLISWSNEEKKKRGRKRCTHREFVGAWNRCSTMRRIFQRKWAIDRFVSILFCGADISFRNRWEEVGKGFRKIHDGRYMPTKRRFIRFKEKRPPHCVGSRTPGDARALERLLRCFEVRRDALESGCNVASSIYASFFRVFDAWRFDTKPIDAHPLYNVTR